MATTNEPILLNETGQRILTQINKENALLALITESNRETVYGNISQVANIVRNGYGAETFPIGDQIIIPWKDMDDTNHNTDNTAYQVPLDIVHHGNVELETGEIVPGMFLMWHYCSPYGVQFDNFQAFYRAETALAPGQYYITFNQSWGSAVSGESWNFTLTKEVPAGGLLSGLHANNSTSWSIRSWESQSSASPLETVAVVQGAEGTSLGTMEYMTVGGEGLNGMQQTMYGHNRWKTSALRQYLNKSGNTWWTPQEDFDIRPDQYTKKGFMSGFNADFLAAIRPVKVVTALNTVEGFAEASEDTYDTFFLPSLEQVNGLPQLADVEGPHFEYWRRRLGLSGFAAWHPTLYDGYKIPSINNQTTPHIVRLRSASRGGAFTAWGVYSSGCVAGDSAYYALRFSPVCVIC